MQSNISSNYLLDKDKEKLNPINHDQVDTNNDSDTNVSNMSTVANHCGEKFWLHF